MAVGRPKQFDRDEALGRAMETFWQHGYEGASLPELLKAMGIARQSLYDTFGNKRGLYISAIEHYRNTQLSQALARLTAPGSPLENVRQTVRFFEDLAADVRCRGCFVANALVETAPRDPEIAALLRDILELLRASVEDTLREARERGELAAHKSPEQLSRALTNAMVGLAVTGKLEVPPEQLRDVYAGTLSMLD
jgi:TetR/AcrR family transcriptional repressor of nem operon